MAQQTGKAIREIVTELKQANPIVKGGQALEKAGRQVERGVDWVKRKFSTKKPTPPRRMSR